MDVETVLKMIRRCVPLVDIGETLTLTLTLTLKFLPPSLKRMPDNPALHACACGPPPSPLTLTLTLLLFHWLIQVEDDFDPGLNMTTAITERKTRKLRSCRVQPLVLSDDVVFSHSRMVMVRSTDRGTVASP